jgi:hypothetical protein
MAAASAGAAPSRAVPRGLPPRRIAEALFPEAAVHYVAGFDAMADLLDGFEDQRPSTCGAYVTRYVLGPLGYPVHDGIPTTREDYLAFLAGTVLDPEEAATVQAARTDADRDGLDDRTAAARFGDAWYRWPLRMSDDLTVVGTSPTGTARIIATASNGALVTLPLPARDGSRAVQLTDGAWDGLLDLLVDHFASWRVQAVVNYDSDDLLDPAAPAYTADALRGPNAAASIPLDRWGVGHFAGIGAEWRAGDGRRWLLLLDTYRERGFDRYEPQPADLVRNAVIRSDGRDGGILLVLPREHLRDATDAVRGLGLAPRMWGNGSPEPEGWAWELGR